MLSELQVLNDSQQTEKDKKYYNNFIYSYKTEVTRKNSLVILKYYMNFLGVTTLQNGDKENGHTGQGGQGSIPKNKNIFFFLFV